MFCTVHGVVAKIAEMMMRRSLRIVMKGKVFLPDFISCGCARSLHRVGRK